MSGLRFNEGKTRYDLLPAIPIDEFAKVLTAGSRKYADRNWERGMKWSTVLASLKRHVAKMEKGEDVDDETGLLHMAHVMCNAAFLVEYYHTHPEYDDRPHHYLKAKKIGVDIDDVLADFTGAWQARFGNDTPTSWHFDYNMWDKFGSILNGDFFSTIKRLNEPKDLPFEPHCYITSRSIDPEITKEWLQNNGFPTSKLYVVPFNTSKVEVAKQSGIDYFIDDKFENFVELNNAGICTFLYDRPHNRRYDVGYKRIYSFEDFKNRFL